MTETKHTNHQAIALATTGLGLEVWYEAFAGKIKGDWRWAI
jgi:hypothetical protein